jgi:uncharacterized protein (TIGR02246 family)
MGMRVFVALILISLVSACAKPIGNAEMEARDQVTLAAFEWAAAFNSRDPARIAALYAPDAVLWGTNAKTVSPTRAAVAEYFKDVKQRPDARVTFGEQHIRLFGNTAVNTGTYTFSGAGRDGKNVPRPARYTFVYVNRTGKWWIVDHHSSFVPGT